MTFIIFLVAHCIKEAFFKKSITGHLRSLISDSFGFSGVLILFLEKDGQSHLWQIMIILPLSFFLHFFLFPYLIKVAVTSRRILSDSTQGDTLVLLLTSLGMLPRKSEAGCVHSLWNHLGDALPACVCTTSSKGTVLATRPVFHCAASDTESFQVPAPPSCKVPVLACSCPFLQGSW